MPTRRALLALALALGPGLVRAAAATPTVPWREAGAHVGEFVTVEGDVATARLTGEGLVLEFAADDPRAFRAVLLIPMITDLPRRPERLYLGRRVRVSGLVRRFQGRPEMVLHSPGQIEVIDVGGASPAAAPPPAGPAAAAPEPPAAPPPRGLIEAVAPQLALDPCPRAQARWREAAQAADERAAALRRCVAAGTYRCREASAALAPALSALEWAEQQVDDACP
ncbi:MAG TPA: hypothetical protein VKW76_00345 [Candidatus Binatia bacterium]|nr:hypothetical protein [Candidatus Binatia bacterium]